MSQVQEPKYAKRVGKIHSEVSIQQPEWTPPTGLFRAILILFQDARCFISPKTQNHSEKYTRRCPYQGPERADSSRFLGKKTLRPTQDAITSNEQSRSCC